MKKLILCVIIAWVMTAMAESVAYRDFTNQDGKIIVARVVDYNKEGGRVQLELKNRKTAWVELSVLSDTDQAYIKEWQQAVPAKTALKADKSNKPLSEKLIEEITNTYIAAIENSDYAAFSNLMASAAEVSEECFKSYFGKRSTLESAMRFRYTPSYDRIKNISILEIERPCAVIEMQVETESMKGMLLFLPDGKIKYDAIYHQHPVALAQRDLVIFTINKPFPEGMNHELYSRALINTGVPLFGFDPGSSENEQLKSLGKMWDWMNNNRNKWDASDPELFLPKKVTDLLGWDYDFSLSQIVK